MSELSHQNLANSRHPALIIYLLDVSESMTLNCGDLTRIQVLNNALKQVWDTLIQRSLEGISIHPRYRIAMLTYSDGTTDLLGGIRTITEVVEKYPTPPSIIVSKGRTNTKGAFEEAEKLLLPELTNYDPECPAPLICHVTDGEYNEPQINGDPTPVVQRIMQMQVPDGNVLVENIFISDDALISSPEDPYEWEGVTNLSPLNPNFPYAVTLFNMSSQLPESYLVNLRAKGYEKFTAKSRMMVPGNQPDLVKLGFVMSTGTMTGEIEPEVPKSEL